MARYHFHVEHVVETRDHVGTELPGLDEAKRHAVKLIGEVLWREPQAFWESETYRVRVEQSDGLALFTVEMVATMAPAAMKAGRQ